MEFMLYQKMGSRIGDVKTLVKLYHQRGLQITQANIDGEFDILWCWFSSLGINLNTFFYDKHVIHNDVLVIEERTGHL